MSTIDQQVAQGLYQALMNKQGVTFKVAHSNFPLYMKALRREVLTKQFSKPDVVADFKARTLSITLQYKGIANA